MAKFKKGQSGNPDGRPKSDRPNYRALMEPHAEKLVEKLIEQALQGDSSALGLCINRLIPSLKAREFPVQLETVKGSLTDQGQAVFDSMANGRLTVSDSTALINSLVSLARITETDQLEGRIAELESRAAR